MDKIILHLFTSFCGFSVIFFCIGCFESRDKPKWGLKSIELSEPIELKEDAHIFEIIYLCQRSSSKFEFRLYFPSVEYEPYYSDNITNKIISSIDGFKYELYDFETNEKLRSHAINLGKPGFRYAFNEKKGRPLSLWLDSKIRVKKGKKYKIVLNIPSAKDTDPDFLKPVFVGGIARDVSL